MTDLPSLLDRLVLATEETQHVVINDALVFAQEAEWISDDVYDHLMKMFHAGAYLEVAVGLVPGDRWAVLNSGVQPGYAMGKVDTNSPCETHDAHAPTAALALCMAALKAHQACQASEEAT